MIIYHTLFIIQYTWVNIGMITLKMLLLITKTLDHLISKDVPSYYADVSEANVGIRPYHVIVLIIRSVKLTNMTCVSHFIINIT